MNLLPLLGFVLVCQGAGLLGSIPTFRAIPTWYATLRRPAGTPPNWVFGPVWTVLYLLMAIAAWLCWTKVGFANWAVPFWVQLALNVLWSWLFFGAKNLGLALLEVILLWAAIAWTILAMWPVDPLAGMLLLPYLLWVTYAFTLNAGFWALNRRTN